MIGTMKHIDIEIPHPIAAILTIAATCVSIVTVDRMTDPPLAADARGGDSRQELVHSAEAQADRLRLEQSVLQKREEILRFQLEMLRAERARKGADISVNLDDEITRSEQMLLDLLRDQQESEAKILISLKQIWDADGIASFISRKAGKADLGTLALLWPVDPKEGLSATFDDPHYAELFGMPHRAIDIPANQGSPVRAVADGYVEQVTDNGYGFNSITIRHDGFATLYGHVESFLVEEGETVQRGQHVALSGGRPGSKGAGHLTTGPHLHFEFMLDGERKDPLAYLPPIAD